MNRLARSTVELLQISQTLEKKVVTLKILDQNLDTSTPAGKMLFVILGCIAEFERAIMLERQKDGFEAARRAGKTFGRKAKYYAPEMIEGFIEDKRNGMPVKAICKKHSISEPGLYKHLPPELKDGSSRGKGPNGSKGGCPRKFTDESILNVAIDREQGLSWKKLARKYGMSVSSARRFAVIGKKIGEDKQQGES